MHPADSTGTDILRPVAHEIKRRLGDAVFSDDGSSLEEVAARLLMEKKMTVSFAESCTGGLLAARLTDIPGISAVFDRAAVTYSNRSKMEQLCVRKETLDRYGAVSEQTACEMALGIRNISGTDLGISVTGIAGPGGGTDKKPVGLVYTALAHRDGVTVKRLDLWGNRERIRNVTCLHVFDMIRRHLMVSGGM